MTIPFELKRAGRGLPSLSVGMRYVAASNGYFVERANAMYHSVCPVDRCTAGLDQQRPALELKVPPIPDDVARPMVDYFRYGYELHGGEAALVLLYDPSRGTYAWQCPEQRVELFETWDGRWYPRGDVEYTDPLETPPGFVVFGDAHSHGHLSAYASSVDRQDELFKDGVHIVVGHVDRTRVDLWVEFVMDGTRFVVDPARMLPTVPCKERQPTTAYSSTPVLHARGPAGSDDVELANVSGFPDEWRSRIEVVRTPYVPSYRANDGYGSAGSGGYGNAGYGNAGGYSGDRGSGRSGDQR